jgi:beta-glucosidase
MYVKGAPLYPFGYGLSYSKFNYSELRLSPRQISANESISATVDVKNTSKRTGEEVVQLYTREVNPSVVRPIKELRGFQRVTLQPGEKKTLNFAVPAEKLAFYDETKNAFVVEPGKYEIQIGASSSDIREREQFEVTTRSVREKLPAIVMKVP